MSNQLQCPFANATESAFAELKLPPETQTALQNSSSFFQSFSAILENMGNGYSTSGENVFSILSQSASACCISSRVPLFELEQRFIPRHPLQPDFDPQDPVIKQESFSALYQCRTPLEAQLENYLNCLLNNQIDQLCNQLDTLITVARIECMKHCVPPDPEHIVPILRKSVSYMSLTNRQGSQIRKEGEADTPLSQLMVSIASLLPEMPAGSPGALRTGAAMAINDALCYKEDLEEMFLKWLRKLAANRTLH